MFEGFTSAQVTVGTSSVFVRHGGHGPPVLLLHGHPRTSATWHRVAPRLVDAGFTVVCPDLRGYGRSAKPAPTPDHRPHSKRAAAGDLVALMSALGHQRFALAGHDRGSYVALRLALDHPELVSRLALLDCVPISEHLARADARFATRWWHWFFFAQPDIPERVILADPDAWYGGDPAAMGADNYAEFRVATRDPGVVRGMLEDYRAGLTVDRADEEADRAAGRTLAAPLLVLWSLRDDLEDLYGDPRAIWASWARQVDGHGIDSGHHMAEEAPAELAAALAAFFSAERGLTAMTRSRAVLAGASGFLGPRIAADLDARGYEVAVVGRRGPDARWDQPERVRALVDGADVLVNLAGRSVGCRYTDRNRDEIYASRVDTTTALHEAVAAAAAPPRVWLNASTATIYRHATDRPQTEEDGELGSGFSVDVARAWERAFFSGGLPGTRRVALRMAIVLGDGPALRMLARAARFGLGGPQLDGRWFTHQRYRGIGPDATPAAAPHGPTHGQQKFSWIHVDDLVAAVGFLDEHEIEGPVNLAAPGTSTNAELMGALRRAVHAPVGLPAPRWLLEPGMLVLRQESELVLKSRWAVPATLLDAGFTFRWNELPDAIDDLVG